MCRENYIQNPLKILVRKFTAQVTGNADFLKINSFTSVFEEVWPQFQLDTFMNTYCYNNFFYTISTNKIFLSTGFYNESIILVCSFYILDIPLGRG